MSEKLSDMNGKADSDQEDESFETGLSNFLNDEFMVGRVDLNEMMDGQTQQLSFEMPEVVETEGHRRRGPVSGDNLFGRETMEQMELNFLANENREILHVMFGDYSEIEPLMKPITDDGGIKKRILKPGTGKQVMPRNMVAVNYIIGAESMDELIESTYDGKRPRRFRVDNGEVLPVLDIGVQSMRIGEMAKFLATYEYAYGKLGVPIMDKVIPAESRVMIQIQVLEAYVSEKNDSIARMSTAERQELPFEKLFKYAEELKSDGNREFKQEGFQRAVKTYLVALEIIQDMTPLLEDEKDKYIKLCQQVCNNLAHAYYKLGKFKRALKYAEDGTKFPVHGLLKAKSHYWCAKSLFEMGNFEMCGHHIGKADLLRHDNDIKALKRQVDKKLEEARKIEKEVCSRMMAAKISEKSN